MRDSYGRFTSGEGGRFEDFAEGIKTQLLIIALGIIAQAFSTFLNVNLLASALPLFSLVFGVIGIFAILAVPEEGILYTAGWTFVSILLFSTGLIGGWEFLLDLVPAGFLIAYGLAKIGIFDSIGISGGYLGEGL